MLFLQGHRQRFVLPSQSMTWLGCLALWAMANGSGKAAAAPAPSKGSTTAIQGANPAPTKAAATYLPPASLGDDRPLVVLLVPDLADQEVDEAMQATALAHLRASRARVEVLRRPTTTFALPVVAGDADKLNDQLKARGLVWLDVSKSAGFEVMVFDPAAKKGDVALGLFRRQVPFGQSQAAAGIESLANIAQAAVDALADGASLELDEVTPSQVAAAVSTQDSAGGATSPASSTSATVSAVPGTVPSVGADAASSRAPWSIEIGAAYRGSTFAAKVAWQSGVLFDIAVRPSRYFAIDLGYVIVQPATRNVVPVELRVQRHPVVLGVAGFFPALVRNGQEILALEVRGFGAIDPMVRRARVFESAVADKSELAWALGATFGARWWVVRRWLFYAHLGIEGLLTRPRYRMQTIWGQSTLLTPAPVRALATLGFRFGLGRF